MTKPKPKLSKKAAQTALDQAKKAAQTALDQVAPQAIEMAAHAVGIPLPPGSGKLIHGALKQSGAYDKIFKSMSSLGNTQTKPEPSKNKAAQTAQDQAKKAAQTALDQVAPQAIEMAAHAVGIPLPPGSGKLIHGALKQSGAYDKIFKSMSSLGNTQTFIGNIAGHAGSTDENKQPEEEPETQEELDLAASLCKNSF